LFSTSAKVLDWIDEHGWLNETFVRHVFSLTSIIVFICTVWYWADISVALSYYFFSVFIYWIIRKKIDYPSHVLCISIGMFLIGSKTWIHPTLIYSISLASLYFLFDFLLKKIRRYKIIDVLFFQSLWRFYLVPIIISIYFWDISPVIFVIWGLPAMVLAKKIQKKLILYK